MTEVRLARPSDWPSIVRLHREQNTRDNTRYPMPALFDRGGGFAPSIALALVAVRDGEVIQSAWFERTTVELMMAGRDPDGAMLQESDFIGYLLRQQGITGIDCKVPSKVAKPIGRRLRRAGFRPMNDHFAHYFKDLEREQL